MAITKKCKVRLNNDLVTVFEYSGREVQVPSIHRNADFVNVVYSNGVYRVVDDDYVVPATHSAAAGDNDQKETTEMKSAVKSSDDETSHPFVESYG